MGRRGAGPWTCSRARADATPGRGCRAARRPSTRGAAREAYRANGFATPCPHLKRRHVGVITSQFAADTYAAARACAAVPGRGRRRRRPAGGAASRAGSTSCARPGRKVEFPTALRAGHGRRRGRRRRRRAGPRRPAYSKFPLPRDDDGHTGAGRARRRRSEPAHGARRARRDALRQPARRRRAPVLRPAPVRQPPRRYYGKRLDALWGREEALGQVLVGTSTRTPTTSGPSTR